jgi:hypothetical protein
MKSILLSIAYVIYIFLIISLLYLISHPTPAIAKPIVEVVWVERVYSEGDLVPAEYINKTIALYATGTKAYQMSRTIFCESHNYNIKSNLAEESYGLVQIHLPSHPTITKEQALDPLFSIKWMSDNWSTKWYGYNRLTDKCNVI